MSLRPHRLRELAQDLDQSLGALGLDAEQAAYDGWFDPAALVQALEADESPLLLRVHPPLVDAEEGYAPTPRPPGWLRLDDAPRVAVQGQGEATALKVVSVSLEAAKERWPGYLKGKPKWVATLALEGDTTWRVAEAVGDDEEAAMAQLGGLGQALARRLGVDGPEGAPVTSDASNASIPTAGELAPWTFRREGELWVLRDYASHGPRESASGEWTALVVMFVGAIACWVMTARSYGAAAWEPAAIWGASAFVLSLASFATFHIARHSSRYRERSEAIMFMAAGSFVVSPWLSRAGAVDDKPEGSYGAAVKLRELERASVAEIGGYTIRLDTTHGPMDVGALASKGMAERWREVLLRYAGAVGQGPVPALTSVTAQAALVLLATLTGCAPAVEPPPPPVPSAVPRPAAPAPPPVARALPAPSATAVAPAAPALTLLEDDFAGAKAKATSEGKMLFVEVWAPWCHTCLSMKGFVLPDPAVAALQDQVVFSAIDSDRPENEAFMDRYAVNMWPTLFVIDPADDRVLGMWPGSASVEELRKFVVDAVDAGRAAGDPKSPEAALVAAKGAQAAGKYAEAITHYELALKRGGSDWSRRSEALHGLTFANYRAGRFARCAELGTKHAEEIEGAAIPTDFSYVLLSCAKRVKVASVRDPARAAALKRLERHVADFPASASVDDRADALGLLAGEVGQGDPKRRVELLQRQLALLETAAAEAPGPKEASTFDYIRMNTYLSLGQGEKAVALLSKRMVELPDNYEPAARLAQAFISLRAYERARDPLARAVKQSYGPRQLRYLEQRIDLELALKDVARIKTAREAFYAAFEKLPEDRRKDFAKRAQRVKAALGR